MDTSSPRLTRLPRPVQMACWVARRVLPVAIVICLMAVVVIHLTTITGFLHVFVTSYSWVPSTKPKGSDVDNDTSRPTAGNAVGIKNTQPPEVTSQKIARWKSQFRETDPLNSTSPVNITLFLPRMHSPEVTHVFFLKVHKAAGTTVLNVMLRFGYTRNISLMLKKSGSAITQHSSRIARGKLLPSTGPDPLTYDLLCSHVVYYPGLVGDFLHNDSVRIAIVREPFSQFLSAFRYFRRQPYLQRVKSANPISQFLVKRLKYEASPLRSFTNQRMTVDFGYNPKDFRNLPKFYDFLKTLDKEFHLVMVVELFDESLVLMRRLLSWQWKDILYVPRNEGKSGTPYRSTENERQLFRKWTTLDYPLYNHFRAKLERILSRMPAEFFREVAAFRKCRGEVEGACLWAGREDSRPVLSVAASPWGRAFTVTSRDCSLMLLNGYKMTSLAQVNQRKILSF